MVRQTARVIFLEILAGLVVLSIVAMVALAVRLSAGPIELGFFKSDIERTLMNNRDGRRVTMENISLEWLGEEKRVVVTASDLRLFDEANNVAAQAARTEILLDINGLFLGKVRPVALLLEAGWIGVHQSETGWSIAGDPIGAGQLVRGDGQPVKAADLLDMANETLIDVLDVLRRDAGALPLQRLSFKDVDLVLTQETLGERARLTQTSGGFTRNEDGINLNVSGQSKDKAGAPGGFAATLSAPGDYATIHADVSFQDWSLESVANVFPALVGTVKDLPSSLTIAFAVSGQGGLEKVTFNADAGAGEITYNGNRQSVRQAKLQGVYLPVQDQLDISLKAFDIGPARGDMSFTIEDVLKGSKARRINLDSPAMTLTLTPRFSEAWDISQFSAVGLLDMTDQSLSIESARLNTDTATLRAQGRVKLLGDVKPRQSPVELDLSAEVTGALLVDELLKFWPVELAGGARSYIGRVVQSGTITGATLQVEIDRESLAEGHLADEDLRVTFEIADASMTPLPDIPLVSGINAVGTMTGNSLKLDFSGASVGDWSLGEGEVSYPQLSPAGADMMIKLTGEGPAQSLVRMASESRLQLQARTGFDPAKISGDARMTFELRRPSLPNVPLSDYRFTGQGQVRDGGLADVFNGLSLTQSDARVTLTEKGIQIAGFGALEASPLQYDWSYPFNRPGTPAVLKASSLLTPDILNSFGIIGRAYSTGDAPVELVARLDGSKLRSVDAAFDLLAARLDIAELNWIKPMGEAASASLRYDANNGAPTTTVVLNADDAALDATFTLEENGRLLAANIERAYLKDRANLNGTARRTDTKTLLFTLAGDFLDLSPFIPAVSSMGGGASNRSTWSGDIALEADIALLKLREGFETKSTKLSVHAGKNGVQTIEATGLLPNGATISAAYDASGLGDPSFLINSGDASFLASVFLGLDSLEEGTLQMSGTFARGDLPTQIRLVIENGRLKDAPFVTQILSLASFRGVSDTLSGDGVLFTRIEVPLTIAGGRYNVVGARASGPALGLTANGWLTPADGAIDISGVLVPSFGMNSALGGLPIIGDLFISRQGEGIISLRYGIKGTLQQAQVSVNPLSAITPGVLRRIFENPAGEHLPPLEGDTPPEAETIPDE